MHLRLANQLIMNSLLYIIIRTLDMQQVHLFANSNTAENILPRSCVYPMHHSTMLQSVCIAENNATFQEIASTQFGPTVSEYDETPCIQYIPDKCATLDDNCANEVRLRILDDVQMKFAFAYLVTWLIYIQQEFNSIATEWEDSFSIECTQQI